MIQLNVDFSLLNKYFGISPSKIQQYANKDFEEIMKLEAQQGNEKARNYQQILSDPDKLMQIFKLANVENKFMILQNLSEHDLDNLLPYLSQEQLTMGLQFFNDEKILELCKQLPTEELLLMVYQKFSPYEIIELMPQESMDKFLAEPDVERKYIQKYFETLDQDVLFQIMQAQFPDTDENQTRGDFLSQLESMDDTKFNSFLLKMERNSKIALIAGVVDEQPDLMLLFNNDDIARPLENLMKQDNIELMSALDPEFLIPMIQQLPMDLTQIVLTQIDANDFSEILASEYQDILKDVVLFAPSMM